MKKLKLVVSIMGLPQNTVLGSVALSVAAYYLVGPYVEVYACLTLLAALGHQLVIKRDRDYQKLSFSVGGPIPLHIYVKGLPDNIHAKIELLIKSNQLVAIRCPMNRFLRDALSERVHVRGGFCEFIVADEVELSGRPLGKRSLLLSYHTKEQLQESMSAMLQRGWKLYGEQGMESNLIDRVYTQTMLYEPSEQK